MTQVLWQPPVGDSITFQSGRDVPYRLISLDGIGPLAVGPISRQSPGQRGVSLVDVTTPPRVVTLQAIVQAKSRVELWPLRHALSRALVTEPVDANDTMPYDVGFLRLLDRGDPSASPDLELPCIAQSAHLPAPAGSVGLAVADIEFFAPMPWWQSLYDDQLWFTSAAGGLQWPVNFPIQFASNNVQQDATNQGDVKAPVTMRIYGDLTNPKMTNVRTGDVIEWIGHVAANDYLEIVTDFGGKAITYVTAAGVRTNAMSGLNLVNADFWQLLAGVNSVKFEASVNTSGRALLLWRSRYSGV